MINIIRFYLVGKTSETCKSIEIERFENGPDYSPVVFQENETVFLLILNKRVNDYRLSIIKS
jgi:hypothetical protein